MTRSQFITQTEMDQKHFSVSFQVEWPKVAINTREWWLTNIALQKENFAHKNFTPFGLTHDGSGWRVTSPMTLSIQ